MAEKSKSKIVKEFALEGKFSEILTKFDSKCKAKAIEYVNIYQI
jgi:hypothetical protein